MAEAFSPDIGIDIGSSNVRSTSGVSMDLSGVGTALGKMFSKPEVNLTEAEITRQRLQPLEQTWQRIDDSDLPSSQKRVMKSLASSQFISNNMDLTSNVTAALKAVEGIETPAEGLMSPAQSLIQDFSSREENKDIVGMFTLQSLKDDGTLDENKFNSLIAGEIERKYKTNVLATQTEEALTGSRQQAKINFFGIPEQGIRGKADEWAETEARDAEQFFNAEIIQKFAMTPEGTINTPAAAAEAIGILTRRREERKAELMSILRKTSLDLTDKEVEAEINAILSPFDRKIAFLNQPAENLKKFTEDLKLFRENFQALQDLSAIQATDRLNSIAESATGIEGVGYITEVKQIFGNALLTGTSLNAKITEYAAKNGKTPNQAIMGSPQAMTNLKYSDIMRPSTTLGADGTPQTSQPGDITPDMSQRIDSMSDQDKKKTINAGVATLAGFESLTPEQYEYALPTVNDSLVIMQKSDQKLESGQLKFMFGRDFFKLIEDVAAKRPDAVPSFTATADNAIVDQLDRNVADMRRSLEAIEEAVGFKVFKMVVREGKLALTLDPTAIKKNETLRSIVADVGSEDPTKVIEAFGNRGIISALSGVKTTNPAVIQNSLDNINYLSANVLTLRPELQASFPKSIQKIKNEITEFNSLDYTNMTIKSLESRLQAAQALTQQPEILGRNLNQDTLNNPDALIVGEVAGKIRSQTATEQDLLRSDEAMKRLEASGIRLSPEQISSLTTLSESSKSIATPIPTGPRRIRWTDIINAGAGR